MATSFLAFPTKVPRKRWLRLEEWGFADHMAAVGDPSLDSLIDELQTTLKSLRTYRKTTAKIAATFAREAGAAIVDELLPTKANDYGGMNARLELSDDDRPLLVVDLGLDDHFPDIYLRFDQLVDYLADAWDEDDRMTWSHWFRLLSLRLAEMPREPETPAQQDDERGGDIVSPSSSDPKPPE